MKPPFPDSVTDITRRYLSVDMDNLSYEQLANDIRAIETILDQSTSNEEMKVVYSYLSEVISHLYVARIHAANSVPRDFEFYHHIEESRKIFRTIIHLLNE